MGSIYISKSEALFLERCLNSCGLTVMEDYEEKIPNLDPNCFGKLLDKIRKSSTKRVKKPEKQKMGFVPLTESEIKSLLKKGGGF
tara:strand:+ start:1301 stop:1555 length:255 start_codon:yes stop_codon:yes gene_type:complete